jgi:hypothetical protein
MTEAQGWAVAVLGAALFMAYVAKKKAAPAAAAGDPSKTPNSVSASETVPLFNTMIGLGGQTPVISFPDIGGTSANVTQPV